MKCGIPVPDFWEMTPRETMQTMEAASWRMEQEQRGRAWLAWHTAALTRCETMPSLARVLGEPEAKKLTAVELEDRRREFEEMKANFHGRR